MYRYVELEIDTSDNQTTIIGMQARHLIVSDSNMAVSWQSYVCSKYRRTMHNPFTLVQYNGYICLESIDDNKKCRQYNYIIPYEIFERTIEEIKLKYLLAGYDVTYDITWDDVFSLKSINDSLKKISVHTV